MHHIGRKPHPQANPGEAERLRFPKPPDRCRHADISEMEVPRLPGRPYSVQWCNETSLVTMANLPAGTVRDRP